MDPSFVDVVAGPFELVGDEAIAELGVVGMDVDDGVDEVGVVEVPLVDRRGRPLEKAWMEKSSTPQVTITGDPSAASSWTSGYIILGARPWRSRPAARRRISFSISRRRFWRRNWTLRPARQTSAVFDPVFDISLALAWHPSFRGTSSHNKNVNQTQSRPPCRSR
jgi:hypothetical protein